MKLHTTLRRHPGEHGFTLTEVVITVTILGILSGIAYPSYTSMILKANRADARVGLTGLAQQLERCRSQFGRYDASDCVIASPQNTENGYYELSVVRTSSTYTLSANPLGMQRKDLGCTNLSLDSLGQKTAAGSNVDACW